MLIAVLPASSFEKVKSLIEQNELLVDGFELRFDYATDLDWISDVRKLTSKPMLFTLRTITHGGKYDGNKERTWSMIQLLCKSNPDYLDLEFDMPKDWFDFVSKHFPHIKIICSYHDSNINSLTYDAIYKIVSDVPFHILKIAKYCESGLDGMKLVNEMMNSHYPKPRIMIGMGELGQFTRVLGPVMGNYFDYACIDSEHCIAPGQLSVKELLDIYHYKNMNQNTRVYGLIGHPVSQSIGHLYHNQKFIEFGRNAVYVKIDIKEEYLEPAMAIINRLPFDGLSITMPLKKRIAHYVSSNLSVINTLKRNGVSFSGFNTDGLGALAAVTKYTSAKKILVIGAGGAASSIVDSFSNALFKVYIFNRDIDKARLLNAVVLNPSNAKLSELDIVINTLPPNVFQENTSFGKLVLDLLKSNHIVMDISYYQNSLFLEKAKSLGCKIIPGIEMFYSQAEAQQNIWFK
jgi:3-dehydroquinate dehydratase/shikimate dehydrogenase